jgi:hypothetical protein
MNGVVARVAKDYAIVQEFCPSELNMSNVMRLGTLTISVSRLARMAKSKDLRSTATASTLLTSKRQFLRRAGKLIGPLHHRPPLTPLILCTLLLRLLRAIGVKDRRHERKSHLGIIRSP